MKRERKGITLVALVITIIVLLILAGITISLTIGQRGILKRTQEAGKNYQESAKNEEAWLAKFSNEVENIVAGNGVIEEPKYTIVEGVPVPRGFKHIEGTKETGFVIQDISEGQTKGNEFVWVPCTEDGADGSIKYDRYAFSKDGWYYSQTKDENTNNIVVNVDGYGVEHGYIQEVQTAEYNSIKTHNGFYIGRYEVGIIGYDNEIKKENINNEKEWTGYVNGIPVIQKEKQVWNYITNSKARKVAEEMYANNDAIESQLCNSYAWDTTLKFIETKNIGYATASNAQDNYSGELKRTGEESTAVNNIYNMAGNVAEWNSELILGDDKRCAIRGGGYKHNKDLGMEGLGLAAYRTYGKETGAYEHIGFRVTMYIR